MRYPALSLLLFLGVPLFAQDPYTLEAERLSRLASKRASVPVIAKALKEIDRQLPRHFKRGEFNRIDIITLALGESGFNHREINRECVGELGLYQIRPEYFKTHEDGLQVSINTMMALRVLKSKYALAKRLQGPMTRKQKAIIAYNGYVVRNGHLNVRYLRWFNHNRAKVCKVLNYRDSRMVRKSTHFQAILAKKTKPPKIRINQELARQFEAARKLQNDIYGGQS